MGEEDIMSKNKLRIALKIFRQNIPNWRTMMPRIKNIKLAAQQLIEIDFIQENLKMSSIIDQYLLLSRNANLQIGLSLSGETEHDEWVGIFEPIPNENEYSSLASAIENFGLLDVNLWAKVVLKKDGLRVGIPEIINSSNLQNFKTTINLIEELQRSVNNTVVETSHLKTENTTAEINAAITKLVNRIFPNISNYQAQMMFHFESGGAYREFLATLSAEELDLDPYLRRKWNEIEEDIAAGGMLRGKGFGVVNISDATSEDWNGKWAIGETFEFRGK